MTQGVSIIICSHNGGNKLIPTLEHIAAQKFSQAFSAEIIYVDNASTDNSLHIVKDTWSKIAPPHISIQVLQENKPGKYFALKMAINHASFTYFIICDDDNWLAYDYVDKVYNILNKDNSIGAVGGRSLSAIEHSEIQMPEWFIKDKQQYAIGSQGDKSGDVSHRKELWGAGMASRTNLYKAFYANHPSAFLFSEEEKGHFVAEDTEYCLRLLLRGYKLYYDDKLTLQHFVPTERLSLSYNKKLKERIEESSDIIKRYYIATKLYGTTSYSWFSKLRLKLTTPFLLLLTKNKKRKRKYEILSKFLFPKRIKNDPIVDKILLFINDPTLPKSV